jgi:acyl carrier protein
MDLETHIAALVAEESTWTGTTAALAEARLIDDRVLDSQGLFTLVARLEREFGISVPDEEILPDHFETVATIADLVRSRQIPPGD